MNFQRSRTNMVEQQIRPWHVVNENVLAALTQVSRELFVPKPYIHLAYSDIEIPLNKTQNMLAPKIVGRALQALALSSHDRVLEVGTGTGYVTACLTKLVSSLVSVEID